MIFRTVVSGYEDYHPEDYSHDTKTSEEFESDVKAIMAACPIETIELYEYMGKQRHSFIDGYSIQGYIGSELIKLGYTKAEIHPVYLHGECLYDKLTEFTEIFPDDIKQRILKNNAAAREELHDDC
jgi:hypothetical protein